MEETMELVIAITVLALKQNNVTVQLLLLMVHQQPEVLHVNVLTHVNNPTQEKLQMELKQLEMLHQMELNRQYHLLELLLVMLQLALEHQQTKLETQLLMLLTSVNVKVQISQKQLQPPPLLITKLSLTWLLKQPHLVIVLNHATVQPLTHLLKEWQN